MLLQRWLRELDIPMDEHPSMVEAVDWLEFRRFRQAVEENPEFRREWETIMLEEQAAVNPWGDDEYDDGSGFEV